MAYNLLYIACSTSDSDPRGVNVEVGSVEHEEMEGAKAVIERRRVRVLRKATVLHRHNYGAELKREPLARAIVLLWLKETFYYMQLKIGDVVP